jgi:hypothetical protein
VVVRVKDGVLFNSFLVLQMSRAPEEMPGAPKSQHPEDEEDPMDTQAAGLLGIIAVLPSNMRYGSTANRLLNMTFYHPGPCTAVTLWLEHWLSPASHLL